MDPERSKRRQSLKIIISEAIMVIAVIITVVILAFVVSGYWINSDLQLERQGMLQISSVPTGATVTIDGESSWLQRTNTSKVLPSGSHEVVLSKEGYDTWSKTINISDGLLYRIHYPRLFLQDRTTETVLDTTGTTFATVSPDRKSLLLANATTNWQLIDLSTDAATQKKIDIAGIFNSSSLADNATVGVFLGKIIDAHWDASSKHVLMQVQTQDNQVEWVLLDVNNPKNSLNLSKEFGTTFDAVEILDSSANELLVVRNHNLHKLDVSGRAISAIIVESVIDFDHFGNHVVFTSSAQAPVSDVSSKDTEPTQDSQATWLGLLELGNSPKSLTSAVPMDTKVALGRFYDEKYIITLTGAELSIYQMPDFTLRNHFTLTFAPDSLKVGYDGGFVTMRSGNQIATLDMEADLVREWNIIGDNFGWLDHSMVYDVQNSKLTVYDFDGLNKREIAHDVSDHFPVTITADKWLYYFSDDRLMREWLIPS